MGLKYYKFLLFALVLLVMRANGQYSDICESPKISCGDPNTGNGWRMLSSLDLNKGIYTTPGAVMPFWIGAADFLTAEVDTSYFGGVYFTVVSSPGSFSGTLSKSINKGYTWIDDWVFTHPGLYVIEAIVVGTTMDSLYVTVSEPEDICASTPYGCNDVTGDSLFTLRNDIVSVDAVYPITAAFVEKSTGYIDSSFTGYGKVTKLSGPGYMDGANLIYGSDWISFVDLSFDEVGIYELEISLTDTARNITLKDIVEVEVVQSNSIIELTKTELSTFPNPVSSFFTIVSQEKHQRVELFDMVGKLVNSYSNSEIGMTSSKIDLSNIPAGLYTVKVFTVNGEILETKLVKN